MNWLDTETKAILQREVEPKLAPPKAGEFGLVLLRKGDDQPRLVRAICRINGCGERDAGVLARSAAPVTINAGLTEPEAIFGQFELICCDSVAVFVRSEVLTAPNQKGYLEFLFERVLQSPEFQPTRIEVFEVPATEAGEKFADQFLGSNYGGNKVHEFSLWAPFKKARVMKHWASRVGARVECQNLAGEEGDI